VETIAFVPAIDDQALAEWRVGGPAAEHGPDPGHIHRRLVAAGIGLVRELADRLRRSAFHNGAEPR
jgi:hypothetical protein